ncbi:phosphohistidine phosphatase, SixA [Colwellia chukchiensis]|uniref:Phosphohistidine phosphatase, SixA n=1 Tax=Colwellia chukchiensis TaxID=641665 RepID=A0A1H7H4E5_9GAMM|nr:phosphohistidine phosphatase SixA [Colwellia chukchiensis]SEK45098.1 phosphohistidine phosphatase, SixA [Colwellia chukchiensis]
MQIFVMRHGQAQIAAATDAQRALTAKGVNEAIATGRWLSKNAAQFDCVFVSPYLRAQQTADAVISELSGVGERQSLSIITPDDSAQAVHDYLDGVFAEQSYQRILIVSHMPLVSYLVAQLTSDNTMPIFATAAVAQIDYNLQSMQGTFVGLVSPETISTNG